MGVVLVVDDDPDVRDLLRCALEGEGHRVALARDGKEALDILAVLRPDVVLLDLMMPGVTGWRVLSTLRLQPELRDVRVCVISALPPEASIEGVRYLQKPFDLRALLAAVAPSSVGG